ncbi:MAG TPA: AIR synthase-related protein, partial [Elusimicrobiota bacterium]|nr:AIR synthase-related protein [Elusimicrobiota bacterium]
LAHITGGGLPENTPRILPKRCRAVFQLGSWAVPPIFREIQSRGRVPDTEMWRTFNMGVGMIAVVRPSAVDAARRALPEAVPIGEIVSGRPGVEFVSAQAAGRAA